jgi:hypothetical protein
MAMPDRSSSTLPVRKRPKDSPYLSARLAHMLGFHGVHVADDDPRFQALHAAAADLDPLADALVAWLHATGPQARAQFEVALKRGIASVKSPAPELCAFFAQVDARPAWFDPELAALGGRAVLRHGIDGPLSLSAVLMAGYLTENATKALVATGALTKNVANRLNATGRYVCDVYFSPRLERFSPGFISSVRVRMVHAEVRRGLLGAAGWNVTALGLPIHQRDMLVTQLEFSVTYLLAAMALGRIDTSAEREAVMHLWRYAGTLMGVREDLLPRSFREGLEQLAIFNLTEAGPDEDGRALAAALVKAWQEGGPEGLRSRRVQRVVGRAIVGFCRYFVGREAADALALPDTPFKHWPWLRAGLRMPYEALQLALPALRRREEAQGARIVAHLYRYPLGEQTTARSAPQYIPSRMASGQHGM